MKPTDESAATPNPEPAAPAPAAPESAPSADLAAQLATAKKEAADNYDRFMRTAADLENLRKRTLREKE